MTASLSEKSVGQLAAEYDSFTLRAILSAIQAAGAEGLTLGRLYAKILVPISEEYPNLRYSRDDLESDLFRLLMNRKVRVFAGRYFSRS